MKKIEAALHSIDGYLLSISRDTVNGWYELQVGLPTGWVYDENDKISCEVINEADAGTLIKIAPRTHEIVIDDLIAFVQAIIVTNEKIAKKEKQFTDKMETMKSKLEEEARKFYTELDELKEKSFKTANDEFVSSRIETEPKPKKGRPRKTSNTNKTVKKEESKTETNNAPKKEESKKSTTTTEDGKKKSEDDAVIEETIDIESANQ
jgi:hypothetical protein